MNNPLQRKMFRQAGMSKQPMGILASSPELMGAVKGYNLGGVYQDKILRENANEFSTKGIPPSIQIPFYGQMKPRGKSNTEIEGGLSGMENMGIAEDFGETTDTAPVDVFRNPAIDSELINNQNKKVLDSKTEDKTEEFDAKNLMPFGKNLNLRGKQNLSAAEDPGLIGAKEEVTASMQKVATATTKDFKDTDIAGTTYNKAINDLTGQLNKEGKEIGLEDVYDEGIKLLGYDPRDLEKNYDSDRRQAFWFNLMNAGLQVAAGESSNALTNIAKGLGAGLQSFGKDVGDLKDDLRADKKESTNVMYRLLSSKRSEQLAEEALDLEKKAKIFNITQTEVGQMRQDEIAKANAEFEEKKFNLNYLVELKKMDQTERLSDNKIKAALKNAIINNKAISVPFMLGLIEPKEGYTKDTVDISDPNTYEFTPEGIKIAKDIYDNTRTYKPTNREQIKKEYIGKDTGPAGIVFSNPSKNDGTLATNWDQNISSQFVKDVSADPENAARLLIDHVSRYADQGAQIDLNKLKGLYPDLYRYFISNQIDEEENEVENSSPLNTMPKLFKSGIDLSKS
jgi:hypothetical protein